MFPFGSCQCWWVPCDLRSAGLCPTSPHCTGLAVLMHHNLQTSRACGVMFLPLGTGGNKCPFCLREMCPLNRCLIVFMCFCWSTEVRGHQADASLQRVVCEGLPQAEKMNPLNSSPEQANGAGGPKVTHLTNPACGVAIHICQGMDVRHAGKQHCSLSLIPCVWGVSRHSIRWHCVSKSSVLSSAFYYLVTCSGSKVKHTQTWNVANKWSELAAQLYKVLWLSYYCFYTTENAGRIKPAGILLAWIYHGWKHQLNFDKLIIYCCSRPYLSLPVHAEYVNDLHDALSL